jgi:hypothetical protein
MWWEVGVTELGLVVVVGVTNRWGLVGGCTHAVSGVGLCPGLVACRSGGVGSIEPRVWSWMM